MYNVKNTWKRRSKSAEFLYVIEVIEGVVNLKQTVLSIGTKDKAKGIKAYHYTK